MHKNKEINLVQYFMQPWFFNIFMLIDARLFCLRFVLLLFCFHFYIAKTQSFSNRSVYEKRWALLHPFAAIKTKKIYQKAKPYYDFAKQKNLTDKLENGGKLDAFRHVFFMAAFAQKINPKKIKKLGEAHEKGNFEDFKSSKKEFGETPDSLSTVMDLFNNNVGISIGRENKSLSLQQLSEACLKIISEGKALYFKRSEGGYFLTCDDSEIDLNSFAGKWYIPKCLIETNK